MIAQDGISGPRAARFAARSRSRGLSVEIGRISLSDGRS